MPLGAKKTDDTCMVLRNSRRIYCCGVPSVTTWVNYGWHLPSRMHMKFMQALTWLIFIYLFIYHAVVLVI